MKRHLKILFTFVRFNFIGHLMYRGNFWSSLIADIAWAAFILISTFFITSRASTIGGWTKYELLLITSTCNILLGFIAMLAKNFFQFSNTINHGKLDGILLKPVDSQFYMSLQYVNVSKLPRIIISLGINIYILHLLQIPLTLVNVLSFITLLSIGCLTIYSLWYLACTLMIWYSRLSNLTELLFELTHMTRYPQEVFRELNLYIFIVLFPLTLIITVPTKALLGKVLGGEVLQALLLSLILFTASRVFWKFALKFYTSASS